MRNQWSVWGFIKRTAKVIWALIVIYGILAGINRDHEGFNSDLVDIYNQSGGTAVLDVFTKRAMLAFVNHWLFFLIAVPTLIAFVYLLVASPRAKLKSEFEEKRKSAKGKKKRGGRR